MTTRGIRGAITAEKNTKEEIFAAAAELFSEIISQNHVKFDEISHIIISATKDITKAYPAEAIRSIDEMKYVPILCVSEMNIENSLEKCIRFLVIVNTEIAQNEIKHVYLKSAQTLRSDLAGG